MKTWAKGHRLRIGRYSEPNRIYLISIVCFDRRPIFAEFKCGRCAVWSLRQSTAHATTLCYVVMPDHMHWLLQLGEGLNLSAAVQRFKSLCTKQLRQNGFDDGPVWARGFHDRALRREEDLLAVARYVLANPLRAGLVSSVRDYPLWDAIWL